MPVSTARNRLRRVRQASKTASLGSTIGSKIDDAIEMGSDALSKARESTKSGIEQARERLSYDKIDENLTPGMAAGGATATGGAGYLAGSEKEGSARPNTNRFLKRIEA